MAHQVNVRPITKDEREDAKDFQDFIRAFYEAFNVEKEGRKKTGRFGIEFKDYQVLKKKIKRFKNRPWYSVAQQFFTTNDERFKEYFQTRRQANRISTDEISNMNAKAFAFFKSGNVSSILQMKDKLVNYANTLERAQQNVSTEVWNPVYIENPFFFGSKRFLKVFEKYEMEQLITKDMSKFKYTYMTLPDNAMDDFEYVAFWILKLRDNDVPVELSDSEFRDYVKLEFNSDEYQELLKNVKELQRITPDSIEYDETKMNHFTKTLNKVLKQIKLFPLLQDKLEERKQTVKTVYRGIGFHDDEDHYSQDQVVGREKSKKVVQTSPNSQTALYFMMKTGHVTPTPNFDYGYLITYEVDYDSVIFDSRIINTTFDEDEIIIDPSKARIVNIQEYEKSDFIKDDDYEFDDEEVDDEDY